MTEQDLRDLLRRTTEDLGPDVAGLVAGGTTRGRARRRRHLVGTTAVAVLAVGAVAAGSALLGSGGGSSARDGDVAGPGGRSLVDASVATHDGTPRQLAEDRFSDVLAAMLPDSEQASGDDGSVGSVTSAGDGAPTGQTLSTSTPWRGGDVTIVASDAQPAVAVAVGEDPPDPTPYPGPERACRDAQRNAVSVTTACRRVENGDWVLAVEGSPDVGWFAYTPLGEGCDGPGLCEADGGSGSGAGDSADSAVPTTGPGGAPSSFSATAVPPPVPGNDPDWTMAWGEGSTVTLFTTDGWQVSASATIPDGADVPVLGDTDLQLMAQDGDWFLAPAEEPPAPPAADPEGPVGTDMDPAIPGQAASVGPGDAPILIAGDRTPVPAEQLADVFADLVPGQVTDVTTSGGSSAPRTRFRWDGYAVRVSVTAVAVASCEDSTADACDSTGDGFSSGSSVGADGEPQDLSADSFTADDWRVSITVTGADPASGLTADRLVTAAGSGDWFS